MDQIDWDFPTDAEIKAQIDALARRDEASCAEHYWCALRYFYETFVGPEIDIPF